MAAQTATWTTLVASATAAVADLELICFHPIVGRNLIDDRVLSLTLDDDGKPRTIAKGIHLLSSGLAEATVQLATPTVAPAESEQADAKKYSSIENVKGRVFRLEECSISDQFQMLQSRHWNAIHEHHHQQYVYKVDSDVSRWSSETSRFDRRPHVAHQNDIDLAHEASIHIYIQQLMHSRRSQVIGKMAQIMFGDGEKTAYDHTKLERYIRELQSYQSLPIAQLYAVDLDENDQIRGLVIQKLEMSVADFVDSNEHVKMDLKGKASLYELCHSLFESVKILHKCGVAHLDIKTANVAFGCPVATISNTSLDDFSKYGGSWRERRPLQGPIPPRKFNIKLIDFGSALIHHACYLSLTPHLEKNIFGLGEFDLHALHGTARNTRGYMPPELVLRSKEFAQCYHPFKHDIYAIGVVVGGLLTLTSSWFNRYALDDADFVVTAQHILNTDSIHKLKILRPDATPEDESRDEYDEEETEADDPIHDAEDSKPEKKDKREKDEEEEEEENDSDLEFETLSDGSQEDTGSSQRDLLNAKAKLWCGSFVCHKCRREAQDSCAGRQKLLAGTPSTLYSDMVSRLDLSLPSAMENEPIVKLLAAASKSQHELADRISEPLARIDCRSCIVKLHCARLEATQLDTPNIAIQDEAQEVVSLKDDSANDAQRQNEPKRRDDVSERSTSSLATGEYQVVPFDDQVKELTAEEKAYDLDYGMQTVPLMEVNSMFNLTMECFGHVLLPWLSDLKQEGDVLSNVRLPALTELQKKASTTITTAEGQKLVQLDPTVIDLMLIVKAILKVQLHRLVSLAVLQHQVSSQSIWRWGVHQLVLQGIRETELIPRFEKAFASGDFAKFVPAKGVVEGFCWRWPNTAQTMYTLFTRGFKLAMVRWMRATLILLENHHDRLVAYPHMSDFLTYNIVFLWDRVSKSASFEPYSREILPRTNWHPKEHGRLLLLPSPLQNRQGMWSNRFYMRHVAWDSTVGSVADTLNHHRVVPLIETIFDVFGGECVLPVELNNLFGLDDWLIKHVAKQWESSSKSVTSSILSVAEHDVAKYGPSTVWMGALDMFCQTRLEAKDGVDPKVQRAIDFLHLAACAEVVCHTLGLALDGRSEGTSWFRVARLLYSVWATQQNVILLTSSTEDLQSQIAMSLETSEWTDARLGSNNIFETPFWYASELETDDDKLSDQDVDEQLFGKSQKPILVDDNGQAEEEEEEENDKFVEAPRIAMYSVFRALTKRLKILRLGYGIPPNPSVCFVQSAPGIVRHLTRDFSPNTKDWFKMLLCLICGAPNLEPEQMVMGSAILQVKGIIHALSLEKTTQTYADQLVNGPRNKRLRESVLLAGANLAKVEQQQGPEHDEILADIKYILRRAFAK